MPSSSALPTIRGPRTCTMWPFFLLGRVFTAVANPAISPVAVAQLLIEKFGQGADLITPDAAFTRAISQPNGIVTNPGYRIGILYLSVSYDPFEHCGNSAYGIATNVEPVESNKTIAILSEC